MTNSKENFASMKKLQSNLYNHLDAMYVMMGIGENIDRLKGYMNNPDNKWKHTYLKIRADEDVKRHIWFDVKTVMNTAYQRGYKNGYNKGLVDGAIEATSIERKALKDD